MTGRTGTPLEATIARRIRMAGPMPLAEYMMLALGHPVHGYYTRHDPLGAAGDFVTAPEISQMFGELLGLWCAEAWLTMGSPAPVRLVELGPGRGTLMADALRATARVPGFHAAVDLHLVEPSPALRAKQAATLATAPVGATWHDALATVPAGPLLLLANEMFDALPIRQFVRGPRGWAERKVGLDGDGRLAWVLDPSPGPALVPPMLRDAQDGAVVELAPAAAALAGEIGARLADRPGAALIVDYGYAGPAVGDTLQAVRRHAYAPVLEAPGEADLTAHVDFTALAAAATAAGAVAHGPVAQGRLLHALGIGVRAAALKRLADNRQADNIDRAVNRLTGGWCAGAPPSAFGMANSPDGTGTEKPPDQSGMGNLFKALALTSPGLPVPAGFTPAAKVGREDT